jgi:ElaB/YqjD/DUF883 family membrane-anchored ribosome-binding protein
MAAIAMQRQLEEIIMSTSTSAIERSIDKLAGDINKDQLMADFKVVVADAEELLKATASQGGEKIAEIRAKAAESLRIAKAGIADAQAEMLARTKAAAKATDAYVHENPWNAIGAAAGLGLLVGWLMGRR